MNDIFNLIINFAQNNPIPVLILWGVSEGLSLLPGVKANGVFQLVGQLLTSVKDALKAQAVVPPKQ